MLRSALVIVVLLAVATLGGCRFRMPSFFESHRARPPRTTPSTTPTLPADLSREAVDTVTEYLRALNERDYASAYNYLSQDSQSKHSRASFEEKGKQGMPLYDLQSAKAIVKGDTATVEMAFQEDPATHAFHLVRENNQWKIVYRGGSPGMPYAEDPR